MFEEGAEIDPLMKERFMAASKKSTTPKQVPLGGAPGVGGGGGTAEQNLNSLQQLQNQV